MKLILPVCIDPKDIFRTKDDSCKIIIGDALKVLSCFPDGFFQCCVTSPPYWGLRDYGIPGQIGAEMKINDYINNLVHVFRQVRRVIRNDGTFWLNIGDSYTSGGRTWRQSDSKNKGRAMEYRPPTPEGLKPKDLIGVPWRIAFALQEDGWYLRSDIIWHKPNCQPESVKDRPTRAHEYLFMFSKSEKNYYYDLDAIAEPTLEGNGKKNRRTVWSINTNGYKGSHFAVFPKALVEPCILAGSPKDSIILDPFFGTGTVGIVSLMNHRRCVGIELKREYADMAMQRIKSESLPII